MGGGWLVGVHESRATEKRRHEKLHWINIIEMRITWWTRFDSLRPPLDLNIKQHLKIELFGLSMDALTAATIADQGQKVVDQGHGAMDNLDERKFLIPELSCPWHTSLCSPSHSWAPQLRWLSTTQQHRLPTDRRGSVQKEEPKRDLRDKCLEIH